ncbi:nitrogen permease regulator 2-domain-containing protein [Rhodocollybia butyracea]|uniref:Nitrogen permease regulator 2-domain-containing protein n=1 Tax=Rhodocollybia butyracea TaxID=206335 RepID=A0A9P5Q6U7_9AGAR|nr:nitrogen permease regulator 2-domain-containing protein [Rhodocollybia butyracea]
MGTFLPRIQSVFYAGFDLTAGPKIICQVPEGLITAPSIPNSTVPPTPSSETSPSPSLPPLHVTASRNSSLSAVASPTEFRPSSRSFSSPQGKRLLPNNQAPLFNFEEISKYVIPGPALCGRLVICSTKNHRIIGLPSQLRGGKYQRNFFRFNLCFVFERTADLSCYEPIVRKISRVLASCEEESGFLSAPGNHAAMNAIIEQLYEDLNSYSETSISIDQFNSIELKIFPFYPNPPEVKDWMVPIMLINLVRRIEDNWDLTMAKVCRYIDGVNHVSRIAHLADCDIKLTREAISHLLYYQVIMTIDIFQYSNMYTLRKSIQWLADEAHVKDECGPYSTKPGFSIPDWPKLLHLYSRMKPGRTVLEWMEEYEVQELGIDVRRFTSFGVIKGFLRRVHRYPILVPGSRSLAQSPSDIQPNQNRKRGKSFTGIQPTLLNQSPESSPQGQYLLRGRTAHIVLAATSLSSEQATSAPPTPRGRMNQTAASVVEPDQPHIRPRRSSAAERILESLRSRDQNLTRPPGTAQASPRTSIFNADPSSVSTIVPVPSITTTASKPQENIPARNPRRQSLIPPITTTDVPPNSPNIPRLNLNSGSRPQLERSPSAPITRTYNGMAAKVAAVPLSYPMELLELLDGEHHTDELAVRFEAGWPLLEEWLSLISEGQNGRVLIIYR